MNNDAIYTWYLPSHVGSSVTHKTTPESINPLSPGPTKPSNPSIPSPSSISSSRLSVNTSGNRSSTAVESTTAISEPSLSKWIPIWSNLPSTPTLISLKIFPIRERNACTTTPSGPASSPIRDYRMYCSDTPERKKSSSPRASTPSIRKASIWSSATQSPLLPLALSIKMSLSLSLLPSPGQLSI